MPPEEEVNLTTLIQSPFLNLRTVGYEQDGSCGILLRWFLAGKLGDLHIPRGNAEIGSPAGPPDQETLAPFNKNEDFVKIWRVPYTLKQYRKFDFLSDNKTADNTNRTWIYQIDDQVFYLRFKDLALYDHIFGELQISPLEAPREFLDHYKGSVLELELSGQLSFSTNFFLPAGPDFRVRLETYFSEPLQFPIRDRNEVLIGRKTIGRSGQNTDFRLVAENIRFIRFAIDELPLDARLIIGFETYSDVFNDFSALSEESRKVLLVSEEFALSVDDQEVAKRFQDPSKAFIVHDAWLKFIGDARVNAINYIGNLLPSRWEMREGLRDGVREYLELSKRDARAMKTYNDRVDPSHPTAMNVSLRNLLTIAANDFHVARMLGLGHIDVLENLDDQFIYIAGYRTDVGFFSEYGASENFDSHQTNHFYLSLPTSVKDVRPPIALKINIEHGSKIDSIEITDKDGYIPNERVRLVNVKTSVVVDYSESKDFFIPKTEFQSSEHSVPLFVGLKNRIPTDDVPLPEWNSPELSHDLTFKDTRGVFEPLPLVLTKTSVGPTFVHVINASDTPIEDDFKETNEYTAYSIDVFSRASDLSPIVSDKTIIKKPNTLRPPSNVAVQLIQRENPLLLTSKDEQDWLMKIQDGILCRLTFEYSYKHDRNYKFADQIHIFHKEKLPLRVVGSIVSIKTITDTQFTVATGDFYYASNGERLVPEITEKQAANFIGGVFTYDGQNYFVEKVEKSGPYPEITLGKIFTVNSMLVQNSQSNDQNYKAERKVVIADPKPGKSFLLVENLAPSENWTESTDNKFNFEIGLGLSTFSKSKERYVNDENKICEEELEGIWKSAKIRDIGHGYYEIEFNGYTLPHHPDYKDDVADWPSVDWYQGCIRVPTLVADTQRKELQVAQIFEIGSTDKNLRILAFDPQFASEGPSNIETGQDILVYFRPNYRAYLRQDNAIGFNQDGLLPRADEERRISLIGLQSIDRFRNYRSSMSVPAVLAARTIVNPKKPERPEGAAFANPPNFFNKANYSFVTKFKGEPWGLVYFRIESNQILACLYEKETIEKIRENLPPANKDPFLAARWQDLLSFDYASNDGNFADFPSEVPQQFYGFPNPDRQLPGPDPNHPEKDRPFTGNQKPSEIKDKIKEAIFSNLLPITEQPLIFRHIKDGTKGKDGGYVPQPNRQTITDRDGNLLDHDDPAFDQAPMASKTVQNKVTGGIESHEYRVLFTDFTLDGNMGSDTLYFYLVRELGNQLKYGEPSAFLGPVRLLNTKAPAKLIIEGSKSNSASPNAGSKTFVEFEIVKPSKSEELTKIQMLRVVNRNDAEGGIRTMTIVKELPVPSDDNPTIKIEDRFVDLKEIPFGDELFYRFVGVREIQYLDFNGIARNMEVLSDPTEVYETKVFDNAVPVAPSLNFAIDTGKKIIMIYAKRTCHNGKYQLFVMNNNVWRKSDSQKCPDDRRDPRRPNYYSDPVFTFNYSSKASTTHNFKFRVEVVNSSGIISRNIEVLNVEI
ncbi:MAG: hypothetical protein IPL32_03470 [Chloracidobacterium sp.]|nr:hypothetical protein [Chloracidobacterium sp.]